MLLQYLHKPSNVKLGVQREIMYVRNKGCYFLFKVVECFLECIVGSVRSVVVLIVSEVVVRIMATSALAYSGTDFALSVSGIAGPGGGTPEKPVGTVCLGLAWKAPSPPGFEVVERTFIFHGDREMVRDRSAKMALTMLRYHLLGKPLPF